jgi:hypothetical protein
MVSRFRLCEAAEDEMTSGAIAEEAQRFGPYVLLHVAGAGGMGRVQLALSGRAGMSKLCVLKRINAETGNPEQEARFRREATLALRLSHGAIAQTFSVDEIEGELCISQEFVEGVSLRHLLRSCRSAGGRVPPSIAVYIVRELARALAYAHGLDSGGVIHRDVVPDNVMLSYAGEVKLIDFGIAKAAGGASLTQTGMIVGRLSHTAPEVLAGRPADARADLFSLGVVMWELLTGVAPEEVRGQDGGGALSPPSARVSDVAPAVDAIAVKLLAIDPDARYQRADEVQQALGAVLAPGFVGDQALAELLGDHFEVERERDFLAIEVARAERGLGPAGVVATRAVPTPEPAKPDAGEPTRVSPGDELPPEEDPVAAYWPADGPLPVSRGYGTGTAPMREPGDARKVALVAAVAATAVAVALWLRVGERPHASRDAVLLPTVPSAAPLPPAPPAPVPAVQEPTPAAPLPGDVTSAVAAEPAPAATTAPAPAAPAPEVPSAPALADPPAPARKVAARAPAAAPRTPAPPAVAPAPGRPAAPKGAALVTRAEESFERGDLPQAIALARSAARTGGGYRAYLIAGKALLADGRMAEAESELVRAAQLAPSGNPDAATLLERVRARRQRLGQ